MSVHGYMNLKSFHPSTCRNRKLVWIAEEKEKNKQKLQEEKEKEYQQEKGRQESQEGLSTSKLERDKLSIAFAYNNPSNHDSNNGKDATTSNGGCGGGGGSEMVLTSFRGYQDKIINADDLETLTPTLAKNIAATAPTVGEYTKHLAKIRHKPFAERTRRVKCLKCGEWGHDNTEKKCNIKFDAAKTFIPREDPLYLIKEMEREKGLTLKNTSTRGGLGGGSSNNNNNKNDNLCAADNQFLDLDIIESLSLDEKRRLLEKIDVLEYKKKRKKRKSRSSTKIKDESGGSKRSKRR